MPAFLCHCSFCCKDVLPICTTVYMYYICTIYVLYMYYNYMYYICTIYVLYTIYMYFYHTQTLYSVFKYWYFYEVGTSEVGGRGPMGPLHTSGALVLCPCVVCDTHWFHLCRILWSVSAAELFTGQLAWRAIPYFLSTAPIIARRGQLAQSLGRAGSSG